MKFLLANLFMLMGFIVVYGQDEECATILPDSAYAVSLPWYNNNQFLTDYLTNRGFYNGGLALRVPDPCPQARYQIPLRINIYRNTQGIGSITQGRAAQLVDSVNLIFQNAGTSIQFYIDNISVFTNNFYSTGIQTVGNSLDLFHHNWSSGVVNVNFISRSGGAVAGRGRASLPRYPELPFTNFSLFVRTHRNNNGNQMPFGEITSVFAHELGHTFGLLHTHHPGRLVSLATNNDNATINNGCYQEFQSRAAKNWTINGCLSTNDRRKCEINGDFLCDTEADPNVSAEWDGTAWLKQVRVNDCGYENPAFGNDYTEDNAGVDWTPGTDNIMSYSRWQCRDFFSDHQIGIMWYYIEQEFQQYFDGQFSGDLVCTSGTNISFDNPPPNQTFRWFVSPSNMFHSTTQSGTGTTAFVKAKNSSSNGWGQVTFTNGTPGCGGMSFNYEFWVGAPPTPTGNEFGEPISYNLSLDGVPDEICVSSASASGSFYAGYVADDASSFVNHWETDAGPILTNPSPTNYSSVTVRLNNYGNNRFIRVRAQNACGYGPWETKYFDLLYQPFGCSGGGGGIGFALQYSPNPVEESLTLDITSTSLTENTPDKSASKSKTSDQYSVVLRDDQGKIVFNRKSTNQKYTIPMHGFKRGYYYLVVEKDEQQQTAKIWKE